MAGDTMTRIDAFLLSRLTGDATLMALLPTDSNHAGVYLDLITPPPLYPAVVFSAVVGMDVTALGPQRVAMNAQYIVKAVAQTRVYSGTLQTIMDRVDVVLQSTGGVTYAGAVWTIVSEQSIHYPERDTAGNDFRHLGRRYRVLAPPQ